MIPWEFQFYLLLSQLRDPVLDIDCITNKIKRLLNWRQGATREALWTPLISTTAVNRKGDFLSPTPANEMGKLLQIVACFIALGTGLEALPTSQGDLISRPRGEREVVRQRQSSGDKETISPHSVPTTFWKWKWEAGLVSQKHEWQSQGAGFKGLVQGQTGSKPWL